MTIDQMFEALGGPTVVANETGIPLTTVHSWKRVKFVPEWRRPALLTLARKKRVAISAADFPERTPTRTDAAERVA